ncbi:hypothetical protein JL721_6507 [Aureococcus anophagefferens]|nr:hypothetical protein JL721_6507 [Aureococcus anophagefferens]
MGNIVVAPPNECHVIAGCGGTRFLIGQAGFAWWCCNSVRILSLQLMQLDVSSTNVETGEGVKLNVRSVCQVKVEASKMINDKMQMNIDKIKLAAQHFLGEKLRAVKDSLTSTMEGHQRQVLGTLTVEKIYKDREAFAATVKEGVLEDMANMGFEIVSYVVTDVSDENGYMDALGMTQTAKVKREAAEGVAAHEAEQRKMVAECEADADMSEAKMRETSASRSTRRTEAAIAINAKTQEEADSKNELDLKVAANKRTLELKQAEINAEEQNVTRERTQQQVEEAQVLLQVAEQQALQAQAESKGTSLAELVVQKNQAEGILVAAKADAEAKLLSAEARAKEIAAIGEAEAKTIEAKGRAEALVLKEKNQTYQYMGEAGITSIVIEKLPAIAEAIAAPLAKTDKMVFISQDDATGSKVTKDIIKTIATLPDAVEGLTGLDLKSAIAKATKL